MLPCGPNSTTKVNSKVLEPLPATKRNRPYIDWLRSSIPHKLIAFRMLCTSCGFPTSPQDSTSAKAKAEAAAADRRREQNRRAQQRFRRKSRRPP